MRANRIYLASESETNTSISLLIPSQPRSTEGIYNELAVSWICTSGRPVNNKRRLGHQLFIVVERKYHRSFQSIHSSKASPNNRTSSNVLTTAMKQSVMSLMDGRRNPELCREYSSAIASGMSGRVWRSWQSIERRKFSHVWVNGSRKLKK